MAPISEYFRSVEQFWVIWIVSIVTLAWLTRRVLRGFAWRNLLVFHKREDGAAYSLSYVLTMPVFIMLVCLVIETTSFLLVKIGTVYAAYAATRSNIVWRTTPMLPQQINNETLQNYLTEERTRRAAVNAMAAFGSSNSLHLKGAGVPQQPSAFARLYYRAYKKYADGNGRDSYLGTQRYITSKFDFSVKATQIEVKPDSPKADDDITVTVIYDMPFTVPIIGRFLGERAPWPGARFYTYKIRSSATLQNEAPRNDDQELGIPYVARPDI